MYVDNNKQIILPHFYDFSNQKNKSKFFHLNERQQIPQGNNKHL
jgi:hypothetical protein